MNILLLGGDGFLGLGLQKELNQQNIYYVSLDKKDYDFHKEITIAQLTDKLKDFDNIVILASKIGAKLFETDAVNSADYNRRIHQNIISAIELAALKYNKIFSVTYYSTSEIFGSQSKIDSYITDSSEYHFDFSTSRHLYSYVKWQAEQELFKLNSEHPEIVSSVKIIRPFNIYGRNQKRGVIYDMIKSTMTENKIYYSADTTRTMTDIDLASRMSVDVILSNRNLKLNVVDPRCSITMKTLAEVIKHSLKIACELIEIPADASIHYRTVSVLNSDIEQLSQIMSPHILELAEQIRSE